MAETIRYAIIMLAAGIGIPLLAALNAQLGGRIGAPAAAASLLFAVAFLGATLVMVLTGSTRALAAIPAQPRHLWFAGLFVAFYVLAVTWIAPRFGVGNAIFFVLIGQMISAAVIDHFGLFGAVMKPLSLMRVGGLGLMAAGLALILRG
ncbi:DMT family transporter [Halodurantibacterium flavum]|uniref:DMT family transporter n=1 Tax=Halodurantibacterium flavum TaxID=1382802 RepID=A0ABW4S5M3_9RHOB